jgi:hypothetical protein
MKTKLFTTKENIDKNLIDPFSEKDFEELTSQQFGEMLKQHGESALENAYIKVECCLGCYMFRELSSVLEQATEEVFDIYGVE